MTRHGRRRGTAIVDRCSRRRGRSPSASSGSDASAAAQPAIRWIASSAAVSSPAPPRARRRARRTRGRRSRRSPRAGVARRLRRASAISRSAARDGHPQAALDLRRRLAGVQRCAPPRAPCAPAAPSSRAGRAAARPGRAARVVRIAAVASPATSASATDPRLALGRRRGQLLDLGGVERALPARSPSASFSSSRSSRCWRSPTWAMSARAASGSSSSPSSRAWPTTHFGSSHGLTLLSALMSPPAVRTISCRRGGRLVRPSSRAKNATVVSGAIAAERRLERVEVLVLPALGAVDDDEPAPERERHRVQRGGDRVRASRPRPRTARPPAAPLCASASARSRARRSAIRP